MRSEPDGFRLLLPNLHGVSWLAGGVMLVVLVWVGSPEVLSRDYRPGFFDLEALLSFVEPFALIASTAYAVEHLIRRCRRRWHLSFKDVLIAIITACLVGAVVVQQYRVVRSIEEAAEHFPSFCFVLPPLVGAPWVPWLVLWFGVACLAYMVARGVLWTLWLVVWWMTLDWEHPDAPDGNEDAES